MQRDIDEREEKSRITVAELRERLASYPDRMEITFGCTAEAVPLAFERLKQRGRNLLQIELSELFPGSLGVIYLKEVADGDWRRERPRASKGRNV